MTGNTIWFWSDTHFGHENIIKYCNRPFSSVAEMNEALVVNWNSRVKPNDILIHCGDVMMGLVEDARPYIERLNGRKLLLLGNHDTRKRLELLRELGWTVLERLVVNNILIQHHYVTDPVELEDYAYVIHGHAHGTFKAAKHYDMGVDVHDCKHPYPMPGPMMLNRHDEFTLRRLLHIILR